MSDLIPCSCGKEPEVVVNSEWEVFAMCRSCGRKGKKISPNLGEKVSVDDFITYLEEAGKEAIDSWNNGDSTH